MCGALMMTRLRFIEVMVRSVIGCDFERAILNLSVKGSVRSWKKGSIKKILEADLDDKKMQ